MARIWKQLLLFVCGTVWVGGCFPDEMPAYVNGGKTIVAWADDANLQSTLWTVDVESGKATPHPPPKGTEFLSARMIGDQVWARLKVASDAKGDGGRSPDPNFICKRFDLATGQFVAFPERFDGPNCLWDIVPICHEGKKCLVLQKGGDHVFSFPTDG